MSTAGTIHAVLRRRAIADHRLCLGLGGAADDDDAYWASPPRLYDFSKHQLKDEQPDHAPPSPKPEPTPPPPPSPDPASLPSAPSPTPGDAHLCLLALQGTGVSWGVRKRVHYVHRAARRAGANALPPAQTPLAAVARADDEESSSNAKARDQPEEPEPEPDAEASGGHDAEKKRKTKRRRKPGRGLTLGRPRKRARRERKPAPAPKPVAVPLRAVVDRSVAQVYAATEPDAEGKRKRKDGRARGGVAKRPRKVLPKKEEEEAVEESGEVERKAVVVVKAERKKSSRREEESGEDERKAVVVVKTERKKSSRREEESGEDERKAVVVVKTERKTRRREEEEDEDSGRDERKAMVAVKSDRKSRRREKEEEEESGGDERKAMVVKTERKSRRKTNTETERKPAPDNKLVKVDEEPGGKGRAMVDRWTAKRYKAAEASLLGVMSSLGARAGGNPIPRRQLREEARKRIGDTGLLDHLLKHTKDKVAPGGAERLRRRHNADGAMEYWLEPAGLAALRREAGVADPYWVPPPGWKLGDPVSPDACALVMKRQVEELATELAGVKRHMEQLMKANQGTLSNEVKSEAVKAYISHEPYQEKYGCMVKANGNLEKQVLSLEEKYASAARANGKLEEEVLFLKEKYEAVVEKNNRLEEQMTALSTSFLSLKDDLLFLNDGEQHLQLMEAEHAGPLRLCAKESSEAEEQESNGGRDAPDDDDDAAAALAVAGAGDQLAADGTSSGGGVGKRTSRKCSVRICKPQGAFQWPDAAAPPSSPVTPTAAGAGVDEKEEYMMAGGIELPPTPPSASSTNAASSSVKLLLLPAPDSPVQPPLPPSAACSSPRDGVLQAPHSGHELQLRHVAQDAPSLLLPCGANAGLPEGTTTAAAAALCVGTELALATPSY